MLDTLSTWFRRLPRQLRWPVERAWYECISVLDRDMSVQFMNYGWADVDVFAPPLPLQPDDESNRYCIQLYHRVAGAIDLGGLDVLEVGSGRGGGASYVQRYLAPKTLIGLDLTVKAVAFCQRHYAVPGLTFVQGDAEAIDFEDGSFDAVLNVESSHCYGSMDCFLAGVVRVLRPGGYLLYADHRLRTDVATLRRQLRDAGFVVLEEEDLNPAIVRALELDNVRKQAVIRTIMPWVLRPLAAHFAALKGSQTYAKFRSGERSYLRFVLRKGCI